MMGRTFELGGVCVFEAAAEGPPFRGEADAVELLGASFEHRAEWIALPVSRFEDDFFDLRTRVLGAFIQKFVNYKVGVVFVGDLSRFLDKSSSLRAFVREANCGEHVWFVASFDELADRMGR